MAIYTSLLTGWGKVKCFLTILKDFTKNCTKRGKAIAIGVAQLFAQERRNMFLSPTAYQARQSLLFKSQ